MYAYQRSCGRPPSIWDCVHDDVCIQMYQSCLMGDSKAQFIKTTTEKKAMEILMTLPNPRSKDEWWKMFVDSCPCITLEATHDPKHLLDHVIPEMFSYILKFNAIMTIALTCKDQEAIPSVRKDRTSGEDRTKLNRACHYIPLCLDINYCQFQYRL